MSSETQRHNTKTRSGSISRLALDIGSNSIGSAWIEVEAPDSTGGGGGAGVAPVIVTGTSIFPAGVKETEEERGEPKNAKRRSVRRTRITLARRAQRKRELRLKLIEVGLLPPNAEAFRTLLETTDPWELRRRGLREALTPHEFGRVLLHLAQRRGALGLKMADPDAEGGEADGSGAGEDGKVKAAVGFVRAKMIECKARTFGQFIADLRDERTVPLTGKDNRPSDQRIGPRQYRDPIRNRRGAYEHCADRAMIRHEFAELWKEQKKLSGKGALSALLTDALRVELDNEAGDGQWKHKGLLFGQRRQTWDMGTLGRCVLHPEERCVPHADMHASHYRVIESVNNIKVIERLTGEQALTADERDRVITLLRGPLGVHESGKAKGKPKRSCSVTDIRECLGLGRAGKDKWPKLNIERDEDREINTDWFSREIVHGGIGAEAWAAMAPSLREGVNRAILRFNPEDDGDDDKLRAGLMAWGGLDEARADRVVAAWRTRPKIEKRLNLSRRAVLNMLTVMDRRDAQGKAKPWPMGDGRSGTRWLTQVEARLLLAGDADHRDAVTGEPFDEHTRRRYATGARGLSSRDRHFLKKHPKDLPPAPMLSNPVVRKAIHEVRRHIVEYVQHFGRFPDQVHIELAREAKMGAKDADRVLFRNRLRSRIRTDIIETYRLAGSTFNQQGAAVDRVVLAVQQGQRCPLCGKAGLAPANAAKGVGCELAHILPKSRGGHNGHANMVLAHDACNRLMRNDTPRQFWERTLPGGFAEGMRLVDSIYGEVERPAPKDLRNAMKDGGDALHACYFDRRDDARKLDRFSLDISDIKEMTNRQDAATKYAARQVMAYLSDALYGGLGLPERAGAAASEAERTRRIFATDGQWTKRLRNEWGLRFDPHGKRTKGQSEQEEHLAREKDRGDHRHHAIDAIVIALCTADVQRAWDRRERAAEAAGINTFDQEQMDAYARANPIPPPPPFKDRQDLREHVRRAVFGDTADLSGFARPIAHRPVKRKLIGALHEEMLFGPVLNPDGTPTGLYTGRKSVEVLASNHLRMPMPEKAKDAIERLAARRVRETPGTSEKDARAWARSVINSPGYVPAIVDPPPGKSGLVRDIALRTRLRECVEGLGLNPDDFTPNDLKRLAKAGTFCQASGVPIKSFVLLRTMSDPVIVPRRTPQYSTGAMVRETDPAADRAYVGGNIHHVEIIERTVKRGKTTAIVWTAEVVSAFEAAQRKLARLRAFKAAGVPKPQVFKDATLTRDQRQALRDRWGPVIRAIEAEHPIVNRRDRTPTPGDTDSGGRFIMSRAEGEMVRMRDKATNEPGYFVVSSVNSEKRQVVLVPHWDARAAGGRKDAEGKPVSDSQRHSFSVTAGDLHTLSVAGDPHAVKVRVSALAGVTVLDRD
jgi:CRISPR-associated endonuclease Csn1